MLPVRAARLRPGFGPGVSRLTRLCSEHRDRSSNRHLWIRHWRAGVQVPARQALESPFFVL